MLIILMLCQIVAVMKRGTLYEFTVTRQTRFLLLFFLYNYINAHDERQITEQGHKWIPYRICICWTPMHTSPWTYIHWEKKRKETWRQVRRERKQLLWRRSVDRDELSIEKRWEKKYHTVLFKLIAIFYDIYTYLFVYNWHKWLANQDHMQSTRHTRTFFSLLSSSNYARENLPLTLHTHMLLFKVQ
jgi:hypothetical protein